MTLGSHFQGTLPRCEGNSEWRKPFVYSFISLENLLSAYYGPGTVPDAALCAYMYVCVFTHVCTCMYVCAYEYVWSQIHY